GAAASGRKAAAREREHTEEDEHVQGRPHHRDGDERGARPRVAPPLVGDRGRRLDDSLDDDAAERGRRCADDAADTCQTERLDLRLRHVALASEVAVPNWLRRYERASGASSAATLDLPQR